MGAVACGGTSGSLSEHEHLRQTVDAWWESRTGKPPSKAEQDRMVLGAAWKVALIVAVAVLAVLLIGLAQP